MKKSSSYFILEIVQYSTRYRITIYQDSFFYFSVWHNLERAVWKGCEYPNYLTISLIKLLYTISAFHKHHSHETWLSGYLHLLPELYIHLMSEITLKYVTLKKLTLGSRLIWFLTRAPSLIPLKPSIKTFEHSTNIFLPFTVLVRFLSPRLSFTFWYRIHFSTFNVHFVASFSGHQVILNSCSYLFISFLSVRLNQRVIINIKFKENWCLERCGIQKPVSSGQYCIHHY